VFLRSLIERLQKAEDTAEVQALSFERIARNATRSGTKPSAKGKPARTGHAATQPTGSVTRR